MNRRKALLAALACWCVCSTVDADYSVEDRGAWPESWPKELDPVRRHARTLEGPLIPFLHYQVPFTKREEFEAAWPHLLKVKTKGAPIILVRAPKTDFFAIKPAGVFIHSPPSDGDKWGKRDAPSDSTTPRDRWLWATYIELVVDGKIVDLNRIALPPNTPIIDERFLDEKKK